MTSTTYPKVKNVWPRYGKTLLVEFENGQQKVYDCTHLLQAAPFSALQNDAFFRCVRPDSHGYGVIWSDDIDLAESELWVNGHPTDQEMD